MAEFTGERVIPGQVEPDLWNEHMARYHFASRLARQKRVLDVACGAGYGAAELAQAARSVTGIDVALEAAQYADGHYHRANTRFLAASAEALPFRDASFDLIVAFEVIEHLQDYKALLHEARRLITPAGQLIVSTPNKLYYQESRAQSGPNPYHVHEFEFEEFRQLLQAVFPHVLLFFQNHTSSVTFQPESAAHSFEVRAEAGAAAPAESHFFLAVCAAAPQMGAPTFVFLPATANTLREREQHIRLLEQELATKSAWLTKSLEDHRLLVDEHARQTAELRQRNLWAQQLNQQLEASGARVAELQEELAAEQAGARQTVAQYEAKLAELDKDLVDRTNWAVETERRLSEELKQRGEELVKCVALLQESEKLAEERTNWALALQKEIDDLQARLSAVSASRWYRMGRTLGLGPELRQQ